MRVCSIPDIKYVYVRSKPQLRNCDTKYGTKQRELRIFEFPQRNKDIIASTCTIDIGTAPVYVLLPTVPPLTSLLLVYFMRTCTVQIFD